jgi:hypothetical protein
MTTLLSGERQEVYDAFRAMGDLAGSAFFGGIAAGFANVEEWIIGDFLSRLVGPGMFRRLANEAKENADAAIKALVGAAPDEFVGPPTPTAAERARYARAAGGGGGGPRGPAVGEIYNVEIAAIRHAAASVNTVLNAAIIHSKKAADGIGEGAVVFDATASAVLDGFNQMAYAAGIFRDQTARLVVRGIGSILEAFGKTDFLKHLGTALQHLQSGGVVRGPLGSPQLAVVHGGETVIPHGGAAPIVVNQSITFAPQFIDGADGQRWLQSQKGAIARIMVEAAQDSFAVRRALAQ